jgi:hypothetical protein
MTPTAEVELIFGTSVAYGSSFVLGDAAEGILGTNALGEFLKVNVSNQVYAVAVRRGRDDIFSNYKNGSATVQFRDFTGRFNPENSSSDLFGQILPFRQVRIFGVADERYQIFSGWVQSWDWRYAPGQAFADVTVQCTDSFRLFNLADIDTIPGGLLGDLTSDRVTQILDAVDWPAQLRNVGTGTLTVQAPATGTNSVLSLLQQCETAELGALFVDETGRLTFEGQTELANRAVAAPLRFGAAEQQFTAIDVMLDDRQLANEVTFENAGGVAQTVQDLASIEQFFIRSQSTTGVILEEDSDALGNANKVLRVRSEPALRVESIAVNMVDADDTRNAAIFGRELNDSIEVSLAAPGGVISLALIINEIEHTATPGAWATRFSTERPLLTRFILGNPTYGILGTSTL